NMGAFRVWERQVANAVSSGSKVYVSVQLIYASPTSTRPIGIMYWMRRDGVSVGKGFPNYK
ncbi:MAG: hypothetical protein OEQ74_08775, partial [Gammaproteobacteria bacterium]|nr:hypothetical protein [Gammaproteobacteria bacterium]